LTPVSAPSPGSTVAFAGSSGWFFPIERLPVFLRPVSYALPLTYGADILHGAFSDANGMPFLLDFAILLLFCGALFLVSLRNI
jgi:ABC-2 type transport system permease protein